VDRLGEARETAPVKRARALLEGAIPRARGRVNLA